MRKRISLWKLSFAMAVVMALINFAIGPNPNAKREDFALAQANLHRAGVTHRRGSRSDYYELRIVTESSGTFYMRDPEPELLQRYLAVLSKSGPISIRFRDDWVGHRIFEVCDNASELIPFSETMASVASKRRFAFEFAGGMALLGVCALWWEQRSKHQYGQQKPA